MDFVNRGAKLQELDAAAKRGKLSGVLGRRRVGKDAARGGLYS